MKTVGDMRRHRKVLLARKAWIEARVAQKARAGVDAGRDLAEASALGWVLGLADEAIVEALRALYDRDVERLINDAKGG